MGDGKVGIMNGNKVAVTLRYMIENDDVVGRFPH